MNTKTLTPCQQEGLYEGDIVMMKNRWNQGVNVLSILREDDETDVPIFDSHNFSLYAGYLSKTFKIKDYFDDIFNITPTELSLLELAHPELIGFDWNSELLALIAYCNENNVLINL